MVEVTIKMRIYYTSFRRFLIRKGFWPATNVGLENTYVRHDPAIGGIYVTLEVKEGRTVAMVKRNGSSSEVSSVDDLAKFLLDIQKEEEWRSVISVIHRRHYAQTLRRLVL